MARSRLNSTQWQTGPGALLLKIDAIGTFDLVPDVMLRGDGDDVFLDPEEQDDGPTTYKVSAQHVATLLSQPTMDRPPYLKIIANAYFHPGAHDRKWGWIFSLSRDDEPAKCLLDHGRTPNQDADGFLKRAPRTFPPDLPYDGEFDFITLS